MTDILQTPGMNYQDKVKAFINKDARQAFKEKTPLHELPLKLQFGSSTHNPDRKGGMTTNDMVLWCKFLDSDWFRPYGTFNKAQILQMVEICINDNQVVALMELLAAKKEQA